MPDGRDLEIRQQIEDQVQGELTVPYGVVDRYLGKKGAEYFAPQFTLGRWAGVWNRFVFEPYISQDDEVLDFGCGGGFLLSVLNVKRRVGVEINPAARNCAANLGLEMYETLGQVSGQTFSKIISSHALEHIPSPYQVFFDLKPLLRAGGKFLLLLPMDDWRAGSQRQYRADDLDMHLHAWTPQSLGNLLTAAGWIVHEMRVITHCWPPFVRLGFPQALWSIHPLLFHAVAWFSAFLNKRRQLFAVASLPSERQGQGERI